MPVVRELINRISFKINPADRKNAEDTFVKMKNLGSGVIDAIKGIGVAFAGAAAVGTKSFSEFEKDTARLDFFVRTQEEADQLLILFDKVASRSDVISQRQARAGASIFSTLNLTNEQVQKLIPFLEKLSVARPDLGFVKIGEVLREIIAGGDLDAINQIVPGFKDEFEKLSKTKFPETFGAITGEQRGEILLELLEQSRKRINDLAKKQTETLTFEFKALQKQTSDFSLRFGKEISAPLKETVEIVRELVVELNKSEGFWKFVKETAEIVRDAFQFVKDVQEKGIGVAVTGAETEEEAKNLIRDIKEEKKTPGELIQDVRDFIDPAAKGFQELFQKLPQQGLLAPRQEKSPTKIPDQSININLDGRIRVESDNGIELEKVSTDLTSQIFNTLRDSLNNITAANGGFVAQT